MTYGSSMADNVSEFMESGALPFLGRPVREILEESARTDTLERAISLDELPETKTAAEPPGSPLAYELPPELLAAYHRLLDKKFSEGLTPEEETELERVGKELDEADMRTPLGQAIMQRAEEEHQRWMTTLEEVIAKLRSLRKSP